MVAIIYLANPHLFIPSPSDVHAKVDAFIYSASISQSLYSTLTVLSLRLKPNHQQQSSKE